MIDEEYFEIVPKEYEERIRDIDLQHDLIFMPKGESSEKKAFRAYKIASFYRSQLDDINTLLNPKKLFEDSCNYLAYLLIFSTYMNKAIIEGIKNEKEKNEKRNEKTRLLREIVNDGEKNISQNNQYIIDKLNKN